MKEEIQAKINTLKSKAVQKRKMHVKYMPAHESSLHKIIKTKEQADAFMRMLKAESRG